MQLERYENQCWAIDLVANCPRREPAPDCPAQPIRSQPIRKRISAVERMSDHELRMFLSCHSRCITRRNGTHVSRKKHHPARIPSVLTAS